MPKRKFAEDEALRFNQPIISGVLIEKCSHTNDNAVEDLTLDEINSPGTSFSSSKATKNENRNIPADSTSDQPKQVPVIDLTADTDEEISDAEDSDEQMPEIEKKIIIPEIMKNILVYDWDFITRKKKLITIPPKLSVSQIIDNYLNFKKLNSTQKQKSILDIVGVVFKEYFNAVLGSQLLYKFEKIQYREAVADYPGTPMAQLYGSIHFLRMFVKMESILAQSHLDEDSLECLITNSRELLKYIINNRLTYFSSKDYFYATPEYIRKVEEI